MNSDSGRDIVDMIMLGLQHSVSASFKSAYLPCSTKTKLDSARYKLIIIPTKKTMLDFPDIDFPIHLYAASLKQANRVKSINDSAGFFVYKEYIN
jgi:hypothetical protein